MGGKRALGASMKNARNKGDAVWVVPRTEYVPKPPKRSFTDLIPSDKQLKAVETALDSFGHPEPAKVRRKVVDEAREALGLRHSSKKRT